MVCKPASPSCVARPAFTNPITGMPRSGLSSLVVRVRSEARSRSAESPPRGRSSIVIATWTRLRGTSGQRRTQTKCRKFRRGRLFEFDISAARRRLTPPPRGPGGGTSSSCLRRVRCRPSIDHRQERLEQHSRERRGLPLRGQAAIIANPARRTNSRPCRRPFRGHRPGMRRVSKQIRGRPGRKRPRNRSHAPSAPSGVASPARVRQ